MPEYSEHEILNGCRNQERVYQEHLYRKYYSVFMKVCVRYAKDMEDAEQLLNDGFLKIFLNVKGYKETGSFEGWMKRIVVNTCLDYLKSKYLKTSMLMNVNIDMVANSASSGDASALSRIEFKELVKTIQSLPPMTRTVFNLYVFEEFTHKEIAQTLGISEGTSFWHVNNGRKMLQKKVKLLNVENPFYEKRI